MRADVQHVKDGFGLLSHAAMCTDRGDNAGMFLKVMIRMADDRPLADSMLLATYNTNRELRIHRLRLDFEKAAINVKHLKLIADCTSAAEASELTSPAYDPSTIQTQLTMLDFIPPGPESKSRAPTQPFVLTAFSCFSPDFQGGDTVNTILYKWELYTQKTPLHSSFAQLSSKRHNTFSRPEQPVSNPPSKVLQSKD